MRFSSLVCLFALSCAAPEPVPLPDPELSVEDRALTPEAAFQTATKLIESRETPGALDRAVAILRHLYGKQPQSLPLNLKLAEAHWRVGDGCDVSREAQRHQQHRVAGRKHAREALALAPENGEAHYWHGQLLLLAADGERSYSRLKEAIPELEAADRITPAYDEAGPSRVLGRIYQETPGWPMLGSAEKAVTWFEKSLSLAAEQLQCRLWLAQTLVRLKQRDRARAELDRVLAAKPRPGREKFDGAVQESARKLAAKLAEK